MGRAALKPLAEARQLSVGDVVARLLPMGSRGGRGSLEHWSQDASAWKACPTWPPDLFAVAATLVQKSGAYAYFCRRPGRDRFGTNYPDEVRRLGREWRRSLSPPSPVEARWTQLIEHREASLNPEAAAREKASSSTRRETWWEHSLWLMAVADEAAVMMGFTAGDEAEKAPSGDEAEDFRFAHLVMREAYHSLQRTAGEAAILKQLDSSLCWLVPRSECCILPKTRTPQVGMTLPRFSHNLALLPSAAEVIPHWLLNPLARELDVGQSRPFNLLLVPYPYQIHGADFRPAPSAPGEPLSFEVEQRWLRRPRNSPRAFAQFLGRLVKRAREEVGDVNGVVLPELALDGRFFAAAQNALATENGLQLFISGVWGALDRSRMHGSFANQVRSALFHAGRTFFTVSQAKHHRWKLDGGQICRYHFGDALDPAQEWSEKTAIERRECTFFLISTGAAVATLVCEDLARSEPVQPILRSVGPNLIIAVLMDGPQLERRWPGRYATVLADDPGSAVLTLTSLGLVRRSVMPGELEPRKIALWKEPNGQALELSLPPRCHGLLLSLRLGWEEGFTLDGRSDHRSSVRVSLGGAHGIEDPKPPAWLDY